MTTENEILAWHFVSEDGTTQCLTTPEEVGVTYKMPDGAKIVPCESGFHASVKALDALQYAPGFIVRRVRMGGTIVHEKDKLAASERTVLAQADAKNTLLLFAADCAERVLPHWEAKFSKDRRPHECLETLRRFIRGEATLKKLEAAWSAAWSAPRAAAWSAEQEWQSAELETRLLALLESEAAR